MIFTEKLKTRKREDESLFYLTKARDDLGKAENGKPLNMNPSSILLKGLRNLEVNGCLKMISESREPTLLSLSLGISKIEPSQGWRRASFKP